ncbi:hypothetical protein MCGE09_00421 [Thaumarchaeota archaeon SCGC AB-539-E09]|nr:hypothetical protein MCGE09_00421 [Thaumarchaeota archaeon SCGC AB-539-E09]
MIEKSQNELILYERFKQLRLLSQNLRVVHHPGVISTFETNLDSSRVYKNDGIFEEIMNALYYMLRFERKYPGPKSILYITELTGDILSKIIKIIQKKSGFISRFSLNYFRETGKEAVVELIFEKIRSHAADINIDTLHLDYVLGRKSPLYQNNFQMINQKLDELLLSKDPILVKIAQQIREKIMLSK